MRTEFETLLYREENGVAYVTLNRPEVQNSFDYVMIDELAEFPRNALEALRQPLEDGHVTIVRGQQVIDFPTRFMLKTYCAMGGARC